MSLSAKQLVDAQLAHSAPDPDARPVTPEPTTQSGVAAENALYDSPHDGSQPAEFRSGRRKRRSTERGGCWIEDRTRSEERRKKTNRSRKVNGARRAHTQESQTPGNNSQGPAPEQPNPESTRSQSHPEPTQAQANPGPLPERWRRGRSRKARDISRSPTPGSTDHEFEQPTQPATNNTEYTFIYETLDHEGLVRYAQENFGFDGRGCNTQQILAKINVAQIEQATQVGPPRQPPSINPLPGRSLQVGGGWHREIVASQSADLRGTKRGLAASNPSGSSTKRPRIHQAESDTATMSETDDEPVGRPDPIQSSARGARLSAPSPEDSPPSHASALTTVPATQPSHSQYGGPTAPTSPLPPLPTLLSPARGPVHARLRQKLLQNFFGCADKDAQATEADNPDAPVPAGDDEFDELAPTDIEDALETFFGASSRHEVLQEASSGPSAPTAAPQRTYNGNRTHRPSEPEAVQTDSDNDSEPPRPNSPSLTPAQLIRRERARVVAAKALAEARELMSGRQRSRRFAEASSAPIARPQPCPVAGPSRAAPGVRVQVTRRVDPTGTACADLIQFNEACARNEATSFVQSATRESERTSRCAAPASRPLHELLDDEEEALAQAEAFAQKKWPPLARDVSGIERQILIIAKLHLFVYALVQGVYQTRATFLRWAAAVHHATWQMELPTMPYAAPSHDILEIMVNSIATLRGKVKERVRPFTAHTAGFEQRQTNQRVIQENLARFNLIYPNNFHCRTYCPRKGHYENPEIGHCIAVALFHGPGSVGMMYPEYFRDMPLTVVAFALAIWQFCIEEWANGWHQNGDLGTAAMREKYEAQLAGLKELRDIAPRRMDRLQTEWRDYVMEYSGAQLKKTQEGQTESAHQSEMRPDTPDLEKEDEEQVQVQGQATNGMSVEEINAQLFETGRQASLEDRARQVAAREEQDGDMGAPIDEDDDDMPRALTPPPPELDSQGRLTARSKGKGRAN